MNDQKRKLSKDGSIHVTDEKFNTISHMLGLMVSLLGVAVLIVSAAIQKAPWKIVSFSLYGFSLLGMFLFSTLHHGINGTHKIEEIFRLFDYVAIFPLIAGTYTPLCLVTMRGDDFWKPYAWCIFGVVWFLAILGISLKGAMSWLPKWVTTTIYVGMGWVGGLLLVPVYKLCGIMAVVLILLGGVFYTVGSLIFFMEKPNPIEGKFGFHEIWHIFVILGALSHYLVMLIYVL